MVDPDRKTVFSSHQNTIGNAPKQWSAAPVRVTDVIVPQVSESRTRHPPSPMSLVTPSAYALSMGKGRIGLDLESRELGYLGTVT